MLRPPAGPDPCRGSLCVWYSPPDDRVWPVGGEEEGTAIPLLHKRIEGRRGKVELPQLGTLCGEISHWSVSVAGDKSPDAELYNFHATMEWVNPALFNDPDYAKQRKITVTISRGGRVYTVVPVEVPGQRTVLTGKSLVVDRVRLE